MEGVIAPNSSMTRNITCFADRRSSQHHFDRRRNRNVHGLAARRQRRQRGPRLRRHRPSPRRCPCRKRRALRQHHDLGADIDAAEEIGDVLIGAGECSPTRRTFRSSTDRWCRECDTRWRRDTSRGRRADYRTASHEARQIGLARDHLRRRMPVRPLRLARDGLHAGPGEAFTADADPIADRAAATEHVIEHGMAGIDDDRARRLACVEIDGRAAQSLGYNRISPRSALSHNPEETAPARSPHNRVPARAQRWKTAIGASSAPAMASAPHARSDKLRFMEKYLIMACPCRDLHRVDASCPATRTRLASSERGTSFSATVKVNSTTFLRWNLRWCRSYLGS